MAQLKKPERKRKNMIRLGIDQARAYAWSRTRNGRMAGSAKPDNDNNNNAGKTTQTRLQTNAPVLLKSISTT